MTSRADHSIDQLMDQLTLEEKVTIVTGVDMWTTGAVPRLGISGLKVTDGPNGARGDGILGTGTPTACVPAGASLGATWDVELIERIGELLGDESVAKQANVLLAPTINLHRSPKGGRNFECYSEDPFLTGKIAAAFIRGVQSRGVATTAKHFVANDSEFERNTIDAQLDERTLREVALLPFELAVKEGGAWGVMTAYNRVNGTYCAEHEWLLQDVLRNEWGFDGFVVTDWFANGTTSGGVAAGCSLEMPGPGRFYGRALLAAVGASEVPEADLDKLVRQMLKAMERTGAFEHDRVPETTLDRPQDRELIRLAAAAGTVLWRNDGILPLDPGSLDSLAIIGPNAQMAKTMGGGSAKVKPYRTASPVEAITNRFAEVDVSFVPGCDIDRTTPPLHRPWLQGSVRIEYFDGQDHEGPTVAAVESAEFQVRAFDAPVPGVRKKSWSCRMSATVAVELTGRYEFRMIESGRARVLVDGVVVIDGTQGDIARGDAYFGLASVELPSAIDLTAGISVDVVLEYSNRDAIMISGVALGLVALDYQDLMSPAVAVAAAADVVVVIVGTNDDWETEGRDRNLWELPGDQTELISQVCAANPRTIVVVNAGAPHCLDWIATPAAVLNVGFGGQELGDALAAMLCGDLEPSGRAPTTVAARYEQFAAYPNFPGENSVVRYGEGVLCGHRWHDVMGIEPVIAFGSGLGYSTFEMAASVAPTTTNAGDHIVVAVAVTNTGQRKGAEVVQVYVEAIAPAVSRPIRELKGFRKVQLSPGQSQMVEIELPARAFAYYDPSDQVWPALTGSRAVPAGGGGQHRSEPGWYVDPGQYRVWVGRSSREFCSSHVVTLEGPACRLEP